MKSARGVRRSISGLGVLGLAASAAVASVGSAEAADNDDAKREHAGSLHRPGASMLAVVSLAEQRVTIYDANNDTAGAGIVGCHRP